MLKKQARDPQIISKRSLSFFFTEFLKYFVFLKYDKNVILSFLENMRAEKTLEFDHMHENKTYFCIFLK